MAEQMPADMGRFRLEDGPDSPYLDRLQDVDFTPVFILGLHRSGTSILYKMMRSTGRFNGVTTYHITHYNELLRNYIEEEQHATKEELNELLQQENHRDRGIDNLEMNADLPLEYAFLLGKNYLFNQLNRDNVDVFVELCQKIQFIGDDSKPLLLKNPWDFANFMFIKQQLPRAKFVFIHRDPLAVINSSLRALRVLVSDDTVYSELISPLARDAVNNPVLSLIGKTLLHPGFPLGLAIVVEHRAAYVRYFLDNIDRLDGSEYVNVRYEDLCSRTEETMGTIFDLLEMNDVDLEQFNAFINPRDLSLSDDVARLQGYIKKRFTAYRKAFGYD
ncbi:MAG: sulfotransferase [Thermoplasmatota archaeon]